jgi:hypothetical protein
MSVQSASSGASFEDAISGVQSPSGSDQREEEVAETFYEKREYPVVPPGVYKAMIVKSELRESKSEYDDPGTTKINLRIEIISDAKGNPVVYKGDDDKEHRYQVFAKPLAKNYGDGVKTGKPSNLFKLFKELTGIPPMTDERDAEKKLDNGRMVKGKIISFNHKMMEYMECDIVVKHKEYQGRMYPYIETSMCDEATQLKNYASLPPHPKKIPHPKGGAAVAPKTEPTGDVFKPTPGQSTQKAPAVEAPIPSVEAGEIAYRTPEEAARLKQEMAGRGFPA